MLWNMNMTVIPSGWFAWNDLQWLGKEAERVRNLRSQNSSIIKIIQNTEKGPGG